MTSSHALTPIAGTNGYQQSIEIDPSQPLHLSVSNASGKVKIVASDQSSVWVVVRRTDGHAGDVEEVAMTVNVEGNTISIHPDWNVASGLSGLTRRIRDQLQHGLNPDDWNLSKIRLDPDLEYDIRVEIPRALADGSSVNAKTASGGVEVSGVRGDLTVATASGSSSITDIQGRVSAHAASGSVRLSQIEGSLEANTASGSIHIAGGDVWTALRSASGSVHLDAVRLKNARIVTVSGSVRGNIIADNVADYAFKTVSGSVKLDARLPATGRTSRLSFKSMSGSARVGGDWRAESKKSWTLGSGEDGPNFSVKTVSGSLNLTATADSTVTGRSEPLPASVSSDFEAPDAPEPPDAPEEHGRNIKADVDLERGDRKLRADLDIDLDKTVNWAKEFARSFVPPTVPTPATPPTPTAPATPATPASGDGEQESILSREAGTPPPSGAGQPAMNHESTDTEPLPLGPPSRTATSANDDQATPQAVAAAGSGSLDAGDSERLRILEALERGEIDIDDALAEIEREESRGV